MKSVCGRVPIFSDGSINHCWNSETDVLVGMVNQYKLQTGRDAVDVPAKVRSTGYSGDEHAAIIPLTRIPS